MRGPSRSINIRPHNDKSSLEKLRDSCRLVKRRSRRRRRCQSRRCCYGRYHPILLPVHHHHPLPVAHARADLLKRVGAEPAAVVSVGHPRAAGVAVRRQERRPVHVPAHAPRHALRLSLMKLISDTCGRLVHSTCILRSILTQGMVSREGTLVPRWDGSLLGRLLL